MKAQASSRVSRMGAIQSRDHARFLPSIGPKPWRVAVQAEIFACAAADIPAAQPRVAFATAKSKQFENLEHSFREDRPRALVQMATGSGKTFTAITSVYRLLKYADAKRILFLVDTKNLGEQAEQEFMSYLPNDDNRKFTELYNVQRLKSPFVAGSSQVCISTIQRMYSILKDEPLDESCGGGKSG